MCVFQKNQRRSQVTVLNIQQLWSTNCCCEHAHTCVSQKEAVECCAKKSRVGRPIPAVSIHTCVSEYTHARRRTSHGSFDHFKNLNVGRPSAAVNTHTHKCVSQKKSIAGCTQVSTVGRLIPAVGIHMCVFLNALHPSVNGWPTNSCCGHTHVCVSEYTHVWCKTSQWNL